MLVLFETPAGYALFRVLDEGKLKNVDDIWSEFETTDKAREVVSLEAFSKFNDTSEAVTAAAAIVDGKLDAKLQKFIKKQIVKKGLSDSLGIIDSKLGGLIRDEFGISVLHNTALTELYRGIRYQSQSLLDGIESSDIKAMQLGLAHSLGRYTLKFSPDKIDNMIVQSIGLLDELDKEINTYSMRVREWYGWHWPELTALMPNHVEYCKLITTMGLRTNCKNTDLSSVMQPDVDDDVNERCRLLLASSETSMGCEITDDDITHISSLAGQVLALLDYKASLSTYLTARMSAIAPSLVCLVGDIVGARLIAHAGSLASLARLPGSTIQILGAEKALFRSLKTKSNTPKYGLIYHASLVNAVNSSKDKGRVSRLLASKIALAVRVDSLIRDDEGQDEDLVVSQVAIDGRRKIEERIRTLSNVMGANKRSSFGHQSPRQAYGKKSYGQYRQDNDVDL